jgi:hypothetical protein
MNKQNKKINDYHLTFDIIRQMQSQLVSPSPSITPPFYPQTQSLYIPNSPSQHQLRSTEYAPQLINN